jgi:cystathionine gamma-synthase
MAESPDIAPPIRPSTTFGEGTGRRYRRTSHETTERLEAVLGSLERGHAVAYASGMAGAAAILDHHRPRRIALPSPDQGLYHGIRELVRREESMGTLEVVEPEHLEAGDVWWTETPSNPKCLITDLRAVTEAAHSVGAVVVCDATFATPIAMNPLSLGVDVVLHAATKAIGGHSDAMAGVVVVGEEATADELRSERLLTGAIPGSLDAWLVLRGVRTLPLRVERSNASAGAIASFFADRGIPTWYPGLPDHPGHDIALRQMRSMGSMMSIDLGTAATAEAFIGGLRVFSSATSLGGVESLAEHRMKSDPAMEPGLVRLSIGIEDVEDLSTTSVRR